MNKFLEKYSWYIFILLIIIFFLIKSLTITPSINDENVYFYMGKLVADGSIPYKDFFFAHPPLQILIYSVIFKIFGFNFIILKSVSILSIIIASIFLFRLTKEKFSDETALIASLLFLFSFDILRFSGFNMGINLSLMFILSAIYFLYKKYYYLSGIIFGLAAITRFYAVIPLIIIAALLFFKNRKRLIKLSTGFLIIFLAINLLSLAFFKQDYSDPVFSYHFDKPNQEINKFELFKRSIELNPLIYVAALLSFFVYNKRLGLFYALSIAYLLFLIIFQSIFNFYFMILLSLLMIPAAYFLTNAKKLIKINKNILLIVILILISVSSLWSVFNYLNFNLNDFNKAEEMATFIEKNSNKNDLIFGDDSITPLIALLSERNIVSDFADSNNLRFRSGITDTRETINQLKNNLKFFIVYKIRFGNVEGVYGAAFLDEFQNYLEEDCKLAKTFTEQAQQYTKVYEVHDCS